MIPLSRLFTLCIHGSVLNLFFILNNGHLECVLVLSVSFKAFRLSHSG